MSINVLSTFLFSLALTSYCPFILNYDNDYREYDSTYLLQSDLLPIMKILAFVLLLFWAYGSQYYFRL